MPRIMLDSFSGSLGELPKGQRTVENAVRVLAADPRVSCFERGTAWLESLIRDVLRQGLAVECHAEPYPWCRFNLTDAGRQMLADRAPTDTEASKLPPQSKPSPSQQPHHTAYSPALKSACR